MPGRTRSELQLAGAVVAAVLVLLTGCGGGFFPPLTTGTGGTGTGTGTSTGDFVYVANSTTGTIAGYSVATTTAGAGTLTAVSGSPYSLALPPTAMAITPSNSFLYLSELGGIYAYSINATTGVLTTVSSGGALATTNFGSVSLDISPDGQWLFALSQDSATLQEYQINATTGALAAIATPTYVGVGGTQAVAKMVKVAPSGAYVFLALGTGGDIVYPFNTTTGALNITTFQQLSTGSTTTSDNALAIDSNTTFLYLARSGGSTGLAVFAIGSNGGLSSVAGSPFAAGGGPFSVLLDSTGKYAYTGNRTDGTISGFSIGTGGVLTALSGSPFATGSTVASLARDKSAKYILAAASAGNPDLTMYSFDATVLGKLDSAATVATGTDPTGAIQVVATH
ncbi:lactonase family protein [Granulicella arctica]|uniref:lactonase family protein n=1 Tax=Granulicella arctica TaxID=940613 RepID=UPI0021E07F2D|nr:lactonase family protein [Granulicella arctica]